MNLPYIDRIWTTRGFIELDPPLSPSDTFEKLDPLLQAAGTEYTINGDTLTYSKDNPAAQDKMATFTKGTLQVAVSDSGSRMYYRLTSPALLMCFLAPLLFIGFGQLFVFINKLETPADEPRIEARALDAAEEEEDKEVQPLHPLDAFLGAPEPEQPSEKEREKKKREPREKFSPTRSYVLAGIFAFLYLVGRILEPWLIRRHFRRAIYGMPAAPAEASKDSGEAQQPG